MKRQKKNEMYIIYNHEKNRIGAYEPEAFPLSKTAVIQKSIFYFDDANPCYLHLNAVKVRLLEEIRKVICNENEPVLIERLPGEIRSYLDLDRDACFISCCSDK